MKYTELSQGAFIFMNFHIIQCCRNSSDLSDNRTFFMNVRQKMLECRTKCPTNNIKMSIWWRKRSETQGQQLGFMSSRCFCRHLCSTLNFRWSTFFLEMIENNTKHSLTICFIKVWSDKKFSVRQNLEFCQTNV